MTTEALWWLFRLEPVVTRDLLPTRVETVSLTHLTAGVLLNVKSYLHLESLKLSLSYMLVACV